MLTTNPAADVFLMAEQRIVILLKGKVIEIGDDERGSVAQLLRAVYGQSNSQQELIALLANINLDGEEIGSVISQLEDIGVLCTISESTPTRADGIIPFLPHQIAEKVWVIRRGEKFFFFRAATYSRAIQKAKQMACSWIDEVESGVVSALFSSAAECLPARLAMPDHQPCVIRIKQAKEVLEILTAENPIVSHPITCDGKFWSSLLKRAVWDSGLVPIVREAHFSEIPFSLRGNTYIACHKLLSTRGQIVDWQIGRDEDLEVAKGKAVMESLERYCGRKETPRREKIFASYDDLRSDGCVDPTLLVKYSRLQFQKGWLVGIKPFQPQVKMSWVKVQQWNSGREMFVPECFLSFSYGDYNPRYRRLFYSNSNGMAAHTDVNQAIKSGVLEVIERDAIMIHWHNRIIPPRIVFSGDESAVTSRIRQNLAQCGYNLELLDLTLDSVPIIMAVASRKDCKSLNFFCGASAAESRLEAIEKAIAELEFSVWDRLHDPKNLLNEAEKFDIYNLDQPLQHELAYLKPEMAHHLHFLTQGKIQVFELSKLSEATDVFKSLIEIGASVYYKDMTVREVRDLDLNISVVKVLIPGFIPITFGYGYEPLAMDRLYQLPFQLGLTNRIITEQEMVDQYLPHFFA